jgi:hypothetical protein
MTERSPAVVAAYAELVTAVADARPDPATERFDAEIESALTAGRLDEQLARTLRWWQRESVRGVREHLADVLPPLLETLDTRALRANASASGAPERTSNADNKHGPTASAAPGAGSTRTVGASVGAVSPPKQQVEHRRRVLVASLVAATGSAADVRTGSGEGRR